MSGVRAVAGRLKRRFVPTGVMLMYHRIAEPQYDPWGLAICPATFEQHLQIIKAHKIRVLTAAELASAIADNRLPPRSLALTFDDGYLDNLLNVRPLLERYDFRATVFVPGSEISRDDGFWWDRLGALVFGAKHLPDQLSLGDEMLAVAENEDRHSLAERLWHILAVQETDKCEANLEELAAQLGATPVDASTRIMNEAELVRLGDGRLVEVAAHGWSHRQLGTLSPDEQFAEAHNSRERLEEILGHRVAGISYPHGSRNAQTGDIMRQAGFAYACGSRPGLVRGGADIFDLPRMELRAPGAEAFERFLQDHVLS